MIQPTDLTKFKKEGQSEDASIQLRRVTKIVTGGRQEKETGWESGEGRKKGSRIRLEGDRRLWGVRGP